MRKQALIRRPHKGLYMLGLGVGCILSSPTALIFGKRPVYLAGAVLFLASSVWAASSASYPSLLVARIVMGLGVAVSRV